MGLFGTGPSSYEAQLEEVRNSMERLNSGEEGYQLSILQGGKPLGSFNLPSLPQLDSLLMGVLQADGARINATDLPPPPVLGKPPGS